MRVTIQRVSEASVSINGSIYSKIEKGCLILVGFEEDDSMEDLTWISEKIVKLRIFNDSDGKMNLSLIDTGGELLVVSQFTLFASTKKGNRPSFIRSAKPDKANVLYQQFIERLSLKTEVKTGVFGADMKVVLCNDGPVTIHIDSKNKE